jgi:hypothetical protein
MSVKQKRDEESTRREEIMSFNEFPTGDEKRFAVNPIPIEFSHMDC